MLAWLRNRPRVVTWLVLGAPVAAQIVFGLWVGLLLFYRVGAYFLDAGFYVYAVASDQAPSTPALVSQAWGDSVFLTHTTISPMAVMAVIRLFVPIPLNFIVYLAIQHGLLALTGAAIMATITVGVGSSRKKTLATIAAGSVLLPLSNIGLGSLAYPHVEIFGASTIALGLVVIARSWDHATTKRAVIGGWLLLVVGVLAREDLGGHIAIAVFAALVVSRPRSANRKTLTGPVLVMIFGGASTVLLLAWQRIVIGSDGAFDISYSGTPAYAHITSVWYLVERASFMIGSRLDLVTGMIAFVLIGLIARRRELFAFPLACLPWMLLNVTSVDPNKHSLGIYGMFPMVIYLTAPLIASSVLAGNRVGSEQEDRSDVFNVLAYLVAFLSLFLGGIGGPPNGGGYVFHQLLRNRPVSPAIISATHDTIEAFASRERVAVDDAVMSLDPVLFENTPLISGVSDTATLDSALFFPAFVLGSASVRNLFEGWITANRKVVVTCLPGGLARADVADEPPSKPQTSLGQLQRAQRCHPSPSY